MLIMSMITVCISLGAVVVSIQVHQYSKVGKLKKIYLTLYDDLQAIANDYASNNNPKEHMVQKIAITLMKAEALLLNNTSWRRWQQFKDSKKTMTDIVDSHFVYQVIYAYGKEGDEGLKQLIIKWAYDDPAVALVIIIEIYQQLMLKQIYLENLEIQKKQTIDKMIAPDPQACSFFYHEVGTYHLVGCLLTSPTILDIFRYYFRVYLDKFHRWYRVFQ